MLLVAEVAQLAEEAGGGALGGGGGVVELVGEVGGELAEGGEFFRLQLHAGDFADAVEQDGDAALRHGGDGGEHLRELGFGDVERPGVADAVAVAAVALHARVGKQAGELADAGDEEREVAALVAADVDLPGEQDVHAGGRIAFAEEHGSGADFAFDAVLRDPEVFLVGEAVEGFDLAQGRDDLGGGRLGPRRDRGSLQGELGR